MTSAWTLPAVSLDDLAFLADLVALKVQPGDTLALHGDLGAGKTTFARALIRALFGNFDAEVPSPTFPIVQDYETKRLAVAHFDFYRLSGEDDLVEIGFADAVAKGLAIVEWPQRAPGALGSDRLDIVFAPATGPDLRSLEIAAHGSWKPRLDRLRDIHAFLSGALQTPGIFRLSYLQGDASARAYARIAGGPQSLILMDSPRMPDGPPVHDGLAYSRIAHLAEDVAPFVAVGQSLEALGLSVPRILAADLGKGLLLLEDLGDLTFGRALQAGRDQAELWSAAVDVLLALRTSPPPRSMALPNGTFHRLARFDRAALEIEIGLFLDWYWPAIKGARAPDGIRAEFQALWSPVLDRMLAEPPGFFLRDFHSPNLFWLPDREGVRRVGVIDFQDALAEPFAYDLASLLQDARLDVPAALEQHELDRYCETVAAREPSFDTEAFRATYAAFGAQRNTRLVGLWVRLLKRDGKPHYLQHMPRTWGYLARNLAHPSLAPLKSWYDRNFPETVRKQPIAP